MGAAGPGRRHGAAAGAGRLSSPHSRPGAPGDEPAALRTLGRATGQGEPVATGDGDHGAGFGLGGGRVFPAWPGLSENSSRLGGLFRPQVPQGLQGPDGAPRRTVGHPACGGRVCVLWVSSCHPSAPIKLSCGSVAAPARTEQHALAAQPPAMLVLLRSSFIAGTGDGRWTFPAT